MNKSKRNSQRKRSVSRKNHAGRPEGFKAPWPNLKLRAGEPQPQPGSPNSEGKERGNPDLMFRECSVELIARADGEDGPASVIMSVSSETPVLTYSRWNDSYQRVYEILDHNPKSVNMSRCKGGLVILDRHWGDQVGLIPTPAIKDKKFGGAVEFCTGARAQEIAADAAKGLRRNVSVGYTVDVSSYVSEGDKDGIPVVRATNWMPYEASFEPVPADTSVGVNRGAANVKTEKKGRSVMADEKTRILSPDDVVEVYRLARAHNMEPGAADEHIRSDKPMDEWRSACLKKAEADRVESERKLKEAQERGEKPEKPGRHERKEDAPEIFSEREQREIDKRFSISNVLRTLAGIRSIAGEKIDIGFERELSDEIAKRSGKSAQGLMIPHTAPVEMPGRRDFTKLTTGAGSNMVSTQLLVGQFIDMLRSKMTLANAGATVLSGLVGDIAIPKQSGTTTGYWVNGEGQAPTAESNPTIAQVTGTPHTAGGYTDITRRLLLQSSIDAQMLVQNDLVQVLARLIEVAAFAGTGADGEPTGLSGISGINNPSVTEDGALYSEIVTFLTDIMTDNAEFDGQSWIMHPAVMGHLATRPMYESASSPAAAFGPMIADLVSKTMLGYDLQATTNVSAGNLWFGAWAQLIIALWSGVDLTVDPYTNSTTGTLRIVALQDADIMCRNAEAFAYDDDVLS